ncbi:MAG: hypothetical protein HWE22_17660 [Flavobacteriales bacterium]|nr:hypothetical protein [Flavobacteriales bacterium]
MKKQLPPPSNWQDFEDLCKTIFGEIWDCKYTIKKHGRIGQEQCGVDVYGYPERGDDLYGIQCKGKDNNLGKALTEKEIDTEIGKARNFDPPLDVFVFATTAPKDAKIEKYILKKNIESRRSGSFEILLYDWDELSDIIQRNQSLYNGYAKNKRYDEQTSIEVAFSGESSSLVVHPKYLKTTYKPTKVDVNKALERSPIFGIRHAPIFEQTEVNKSWYKVEATLKNTGNVPLNNWKLYLNLDDSFEGIDDDYQTGAFGLKLLDIELRTVLTFDEEKQILCLPYKDQPLVPKDSKSFKWWFLAPPKTKRATVSWEFLSGEYSEEGKIVLIFEPEYKEKKEYFIIDDDSERVEREEFSYLIEKAE